MPTLSKFWLINGGKKTGKKSTKKIKKLSKPKTVKIKKLSVKKMIKPMPKKSVTSSIKTVKEKVIIPEIVSIPEFKTVKKYKKTGAKTMKKAKVSKRKIAVAKTTKSGKHRVVAYKRGSALMTSPKAKIAKKNYKINSLSTKGLAAQIKPVAILGGVSVASMIGINKTMEYIPYIKNLTGVSKSLSKVGVGVVGMIAAKKFIKNSTVANGILLGAVISAIADILATRNVSVAPVVNSTETVGAVKTYGNPALMYGRPLAPLGTQNYSGLNGIKVSGVNGYRLPAKVETMQGAELY